MSKKLFLAEKILGILQVIFGLFIIYTIAAYIIQNAIFMRKRLTTEWADVAILSYIKHSWFVFSISILMVISGALLLKNKRISWSLSLCAWILIVYSIISLFFPIDITTTILFQNNSEYWIFGTFILLIVYSLTILLLKPIREKYTVNKKTWLNISGILIVAIFIKHLI